MNGKRRNWVSSTTGNSMPAVVGAARKSMRDYLTAAGAVAADVTALRVHTPALNGPSKYELVFGVTFWTEVTLDEWLDAAMDEAVAEQGPGIVKLPEGVAPT